MKIQRRAFLKSIIATTASLTSGCAFVRESKTGNRNRNTGNDTSARELKRAIDYPYDRPTASYLFVQGGRYLEYKTFDTDPTSAKSLLWAPDGEISVPDFLKQQHLSTKSDTPRTAVIGYGSNPAVEQLERKFGNNNYYGGPFTGNPIIPVIKARINDFDVAYMGHIGFYGAVPATFASSPGTRTVIWLTFLTEDQLIRMHQTEKVGSDYDYGTLQNVSIVLEDGRPLNAANIYMDRFGALVWEGYLISLAKIEASNRINPSLLEPEMLDLLRKRFSPTTPLNEFILKNIHDENFRKQQNKTLHRETRPFSDQRFKPIKA